ncbi:general substrate transporter [Dipodascopsis uninucleata]
MVNYRIYFTAITACVGGLLFGYDTGFIGSAVAIDSFQRDFGMLNGNAANIKGNIVATLQAGCFFGTLIMAGMTSKWGRKWGMAIASFVFIIGAILQTVTTHSLNLLYAGRVVSGLGVGAASMLAPTYLSETAPREIRGKLGTLYGFSIFFGIMVSYWIDYGCEQGLSPEGHNQWRVPVALQLVPGTLLFLGAVLLPESPRWLAKVGRREQALKNLAYIRMLDEDDPVLQQEYTDIIRSIEEEFAIAEGVTWKEMFGKAYRKRVLIGFLVMVAQQLTGTNALTYYAPLLFNTFGLTGTSSSLFATGVYGVVKTVFSMLFLLFLAERAGRRLSLFVGASLMSSIMLVIGIVLAKFPPAADATSPSPPSYAMIVLVYVYCVVYASSWGPVPFTLVSEIYPNRIREYCVALGLATQWGFNFMISKVIPIAIANIGWRTFLMFAIFNGSIAVFVFFVVRETSGVALEHMDELFSTGFFMKPNEWNFHRRPIVDNKNEIVELERQLSVKNSPDDGHIEYDGVSEHEMRIHRK